MLEEAIHFSPKKQFLEAAAAAAASVKNPSNVVLNVPSNSMPAATATDYEVPDPYDSREVNDSPRHLSAEECRIMIRPPSSEGDASADGKTPKTEQNEDGEEEEEGGGAEEEERSTAAYDMDGTDSEGSPTMEGGQCSPKMVHSRQILDAEKRARKFVCRYCHKAFGLMNVLKVHERIHTGEKPYICEICHKAFNQSGSLNRHKNTHRKRCSDNRSYPCRFCSCEFLHSSHLQDHENTAHLGELVHIQQEQQQQQQQPQHATLSSGVTSACMLPEQRALNALSVRAASKAPEASLSKPDEEMTAAAVADPAQSLHFPLAPLGMKGLYSPYSLSNGLASLPRQQLPMPPFTGPPISSSPQIPQLPPPLPHLLQSSGLTSLRCEICSKKFPNRVELEVHLRQHYLQYTGAMPFSPGAKLPELPSADQHFLSDPKSALDFLTEARAEFEGRPTPSNENLHCSSEAYQHEKQQQQQQHLHQPSSQQYPPPPLRPDVLFQRLDAASTTQRDFPQFYGQATTPGGVPPPTGLTNPGLLAAALLGTTSSTGSAPVGSNSLPLSVSQLLGALVGIAGLGDANKFGGPPTAGLLPPSVLAASDPLLNAVLKLVNPPPPPPPSSAEVFSTTPTTTATTEAPSVSSKTKFNTPTTVTPATSRPDLSLSILNLLAGESTHKLQVSGHGAAAGGGGGITTPGTTLFSSPHPPETTSMTGSPNGSSSTKSCCISPKSGSSAIYGSYEGVARTAAVVEAVKVMEPHPPTPSFLPNPLSAAESVDGRRENGREKASSAGGRRRYSPSLSSSLDGKQCIYCDKRFTCSSALRIHFRKHSGERPYKCKFCHKAFSQNGTLKRHYQTCKVALARGEGVSSESAVRHASAPGPPQLHRPPSTNMETPQQSAAITAAAAFAETPNAGRGEIFDLFKTESPLQHLPNTLTQRINFPSLLNAALPSQAAQVNGYGDSALLGQKIEGTLRRLIFEKASFPAQRLPGSLHPFGPFVPRTEKSELSRQATAVGWEEGDAANAGHYTVEEEGPEDLSSSRIWEKHEEMQEGSNADADQQATKISSSGHDTTGKWQHFLSTNHKNEPRYESAASFPRSLLPSSPHRPKSADAAGTPGLFSATEDLLDSLTRLGHIFECEACGLFFRERALWKTHNSLHGPGSEQDSFVCSLCGQCLSDACAFALHFAEDHHEHSPGDLRNRSSGENSCEDHTVADCSQTPTKPTASSSSSSSSSSSVTISAPTAFHLRAAQEGRIPASVSLKSGPENHSVQGHTDARGGYWLSFNTDALDASSSPVRNETQMDTE